VLFAQTAAISQLLSLRGEGQAVQQSSPERSVQLVTSYCSLLFWVLHPVSSSETVSSSEIAPCSKKFINQSEKSP